MKIAIIGHGFVGKALKNGLKDNTDLFIVDPVLKTKIQDLKNFKPDIVFICVPTPMKNDSSQDISIVVDVIKQINKLSIKSHIVLKSTVLPNYIKDLEAITNRFVYNPEFLRELSANEDFIKSDLIIFGGSKKSCQFIANFYKNNTKCFNKDYIFTDAITASLIKYSINSFLSTKVTFFNELFDVFKKSGSTETWDNFISALTKDKRMGNSHMQVPGHDGRFGFGGACLPKDSSAFYAYSNSLNAPIKLLEQAISINNNIRASYNINTERELEQNIHFLKKE